MLERLKDLEQQYVFLRWVTGNEYGKIDYVGSDFIEFSIIDVNRISNLAIVIIFVFIKCHPHN